MAIMSTMSYIYENNKLYSKEIDINDKIIFEAINNNKLSIDELIGENIILKKKVNYLENKIKELREEYELKIQEFKKENKIKINKLNKENKKLKKEIQKLKKEHKLTINKLKEENELTINKLKEENELTINKLKEDHELKINKLNNKIDTLINRKYIKRIIIACQDLNNKEFLEKLFDIPCNILMNKLRNNRNFDCHFIFNDDTDDIILCKEKALYDILTKLDDDKKQILNNKMDSKLVDAIINFLAKKSYDNINDDDYEQNIEWFDE